jgi:CheY-like chemotaxis protein
MVAVHDNGVGMSEETRAKAIDPFFTTKGPGKGSGLGLSQVYGFARQSGGQIELQSTIGKGTSVRLFLPRLQDEAATDESSERSQKIGTVLVTEDDPDVLCVSVETVRLLGYEVYSAANASEALTILRRQTPIDILFTDVVMPNGMDGIQLAHEARKMRPGLRVLLSSGYSRLDAKDENIEFITKPYQLPELARHLSALLQKPAPAPSYT